MKKIIATVAIMSALALASQAAVIALWENDHLAGNEATSDAGEAPSTGSKDANLTTAQLGRGPGATATNYADTFAMRNAHSVDLATAMTNDRYWTITLAAASGYQMDLSSIFVRFSAQNTNDNNVNFTLMSDKTGFNAGDALATWTFGMGGVQGVTATLDLSGVLMFSQ